MSVTLRVEAEYQVNHTESIIPESHVKDCDDAPAFGICILAVKNSKKKLGSSRTRKSAQRGKVSETNAPMAKKASSNGAASGSKSTLSKHSRNKDSSNSSNKPSTKSNTSIKDNDRIKSSVTRFSVGREDRNLVFKIFDEDLHISAESDSDDSDTDPSLVKDCQLKILQSSVKNLKKELHEKCCEVEDLQKTMKEKDAELAKLRVLNMQLQESLLEGLARPLSLPNSRSSSLSSMSMTSLFDWKSPHCSRSRTVSTSSSLASLPASPLIVLPPGTPTSKRKTPPTTPVSTGKRKVQSFDVSPERDLNNTLCSSPFKWHSSMNSRTNAILNKSVDDMDWEAPKQSKDHLAENEKSDRVLFCKGYEVDGEKLALIEGRPLSKSNDGSYVKELAMLVYGGKVLYNSSISERRYSKSADKEDKVPRPKLDSIVIREIANRLYRRVCKEAPGGVPPPDQHCRFKTSTVNKLIGDKIKKMRRNPNFKNMEDLQWQADKQLNRKNNDESVDQELS